MTINPDVLNRYKDFNWNALLRENLGESGKLNNVKENLERIKNLLEKILSYQTTLQQIPNYERNLESIVIGLLDELETQLLKNYSDVNQRESKLTFVRQKEESLVSQLNPILSYLQFVDPVNETRQKELEKSSLELEKKLKEIDQLMSKVENSVEISGRIAGGQEVTLYGKEFEKMAEGEYSLKEYKIIKWPFFSKKKCVFRGNRQKAFNNLCWMFISLISTVVIAGIFVFGKQLTLVGQASFLQNLWNTILEQNVLLKLIIISAGGYLVSHFSRNYSAEMNMYYVNKHRQLALNSHERILEAVKNTTTDNDLETKNAILLQVTKTMFDIQETGYLKNGNNPIPTTQIIETVKSGASK